MGSGSPDSSIDSSEHSDNEETLEELAEKASIQKSATAEAQKSVKSLISKKEALSEIVPKTPNGENLSIQELESRGKTIDGTSPDRAKDILLDDEQMKKLIETVEAQVDQLKFFSLSIED